MIFFAVVLMPIIFFLFTLGLDLSLYFTVSDKMQKGVDEAALYGYRYLPSRADTDAAVRNYLDGYGDRHHLPASAINVTVENDSVSILLESLSPLNFSRWFGFDAGLPVQAFASARAAPLDVFIALDCGSYVAPDAIGGRPWGNETEWPAANFFSDEFPLYRRDPADGSRQIRVNPRLVTQQCFNPVFSRAKLAAMSLYGFFSGYRMNSIGLGFFPGQLFEMDVARNVTKGGLRSDGTGNHGEADFDDRSGGLYSSNLMCAAAAAREHVTGSYNFPQAPVVDPVVFESYLSFNPDYRAHARAAEVIWSRAANSAGNPDIAGVLRTIRGSLYSAASRAERGGLTAKAKKVGMILLGDLPGQGGEKYPAEGVERNLRAELSVLAEQTAQFGYDTTLYFVIYKRDDLDDESEFMNGLSSLDILFKSHESRGEKHSLRLKVVGGMGPQELVNEAAATLVLDQRAVVLSR